MLSLNSQIFIQWFFLVGMEEGKLLFRTDIDIYDMIQKQEKKKGKTWDTMVHERKKCKERKGIKQRNGQREPKKKEKLKASLPFFLAYHTKVLDSMIDCCLGVNGIVDP